MKRRYDLTRSDNYPKTEQNSSVVSGTGTFKVITGFPTSSAIITNIKAFSTPGTTQSTIFEKEYLLSEAAMDFRFSPPTPVFINQIELEFSRHVSTLRDFYIKGFIQKNETNLVEEYESLTKKILINEQFVMKSDDYLDFFADFAESAKSSSSSSSSLSINTSSDSSQSSTSTSTSSESSRSSSSTESSASSDSSLSSLSSSTSSPSSTSNSSSSLLSSASSLSSDISSQSSESSASTTSMSTSSSTSSASQSSQSLSSSLSSSSSTGEFRVNCKIYYTELSLLPESNLFQTIENPVKLYVSDYASDGFYVKYENFPSSIVVDIYYFAI